MDAFTATSTATSTALYTLDTTNPVSFSFQRETILFLPKEGAASSGYQEIKELNNSLDALLLADNKTAESAFKVFTKLSEALKFNEWVTRLMPLKERFKDNAEDGVRLEELY